MTRRMLKLTWVLGSLFSLLVTLIAYDGRSSSDADLLLGYAMFTLSFPLSMVFAAFLSALGQIIYATTDHVFMVSYTSIVLTWLAFFIVGYVQWFVLLPWLWCKWKKTSVRWAKVSRRR